MHGLILGSIPDLATPAQWAVTLAWLPLVVAVGWGFGKLVRDPAMAYCRRFKFAGTKGPTRVAPGSPVSGTQYVGRGRCAGALGVRHQWCQTPFALEALDGRGGSCFPIGRVAETVILGLVPRTHGAASLDRTDAAPACQT
jgi:hypothetical protein